MAINIKGDIVDNATGEVYSWLGMDAVTPKSIAEQLDALNGQATEVDIASNGGDVFAASEIYTMLRSYDGKVVVNIQGLAASAASVIAMAGDEVNISPTAQIMIHKAWMQTAGNADDLTQDSKSLDETDQSIVNAYEDKTGLDRQDLLKLMQDETWMSAKEAVDKGFADKILFVDEQQPQVVNATRSIPNHAAVNKFMTMIAKQGPQNWAPEAREEPVAPTLREQKLAILLDKPKEA